MNIEASNSRNTPTYLAHYDMRRAPFSTRIENEMYCAHSALTQRLDLLLHLTQYGNELLLVTAEEGGGKTSMLQQFIKRAQSNWSVGNITATDSSNKEQFIKLIYRQFLLKGGSRSKSLSSDELTSNEVKKHLEAYLLENRRVVLLIDDTDKLPIDVLELLLDLSTIIQHGKSSLQLILFCHPQIKIKLAAPELEQKRFLKQRKVDLPKLTISQTDNLIQHRLNETGMEGRKIFTQATIKRIYKISKGNPDHICNMAHQILTDSTPKARHRFFNLNLILHPPIPGSTNTLVVSLVILALVSILYFQDTINTFYLNDSGSIEQTQMELKIPGTANLKQKTEPTIMDLQQIPIDSEHTEQLGHAAIEDLTSPDSEDTATTSGIDKPIEKPGSDSGNRHQSTPVITLGKATIDIEHQTKWILAQKSDYYTLQLLAGYNLSTIKNFLTQYSLNNEKLAYYLSYNNGKRWHSLVYGIYPNRDTARLAIKTLPAELAIAKPWIRKLHFIKRDINDAL